MKRWLIALVVLCAVLTPSIAMAADATCDSGRILPPCTCSGDCQLTDFVQLFINLYAFGLHLAAPLAIFFIVIGSVVLVTASGYSERINMGKTMIVQAITGLIIVLLSWVIVDTAIFLITNDRDRTVFGKPWFGGFTYVCEDDALQQGCVGGNVSELKRNLARLGYQVGDDESYGPETTNAVASFQEDMNTRVVVEDGRLACDGTAEGTIVWNAVFLLDCPGGTCIASSDAIAARKLSVNGAANQKTQDAIANIIQSAVDDEFAAVCKT